MNKLLNGLCVGAALCALGLTAATTPAAHAAGVNFSITLGDVVFGYSDGYYDKNRRWHRWRNSQERRWYQSNHRNSFYNLQRDRDTDRNRRDWRNGRGSRLARRREPLTFKSGIAKGLGETPGLFAFARARR
ncbi:MAG: hypothetical protein WDN08_17260 [Rhizomicrobium sp.]